MDRITETTIETKRYPAFTMAQLFESAGQYARAARLYAEAGAPKARARADALASTAAAASFFLTLRRSLVVVCLEDAAMTTTETPGPSLCDICRDPGACCRSFTLLGVTLPPGSTREQALAELNLIIPGAPFLPVSEVPLGAPSIASVLWEWSCPKLAPGGRCSIYDDRPTTCRQYVAGTEGLCVMTGVALSVEERAALGSNAPPEKPTMIERILTALVG